ncbi:MAG: M18 family aminopeptidase, partial [Lactimicrobium massiliense]
MNTNEVNQELLSFLSKGVTAFHAIAAVKEKLDQEGFQELAESEPWSLEDGGRYYAVRNQSALIAFRYHHDYHGYMMGAAHCDSPSFKIKVNPEMKENGYVKLNVEMYGGALIYPWLDRPLSVAGRIVVRQGDSLVTKLVKVDKDLLMIPSLAIHM